MGPLFVHHGIIIDVLVFLVIAVVATPLCHRLKVSPVVGYLVAGSLVGPAGLSLLEGDDGAQSLAEFGITVLLFMIGLELSLDRLKVIRHYIFGLGSAQVAITAALIGWAAVFLGMSPEGALVVGTALAFSSTAFVLQILAEKNELNSRTGRVAVAVLILQDLAVVPVLVLVPLLHGDRATMAEALALAAAKTVLAMGAIFLASRLAARPLFQAVAAARTPEVFVAAALLVVIGTAWATERAGLSHSLGAFLAGVMLASTEYRHQIEADLQPLRGLLMGLFFLTVGMGIDPGVLITQLHTVAAGVAALVAVKALVIVALARAFRFPLAQSIHLGLLLAQGGEFAFVVLARAGEAGLVAPAAAGLLTAIVAVSMAATPLLAALGEQVVRRRVLKEGEAVAPHGESDVLTGHVVIAGFGRVGRTVAAILSNEDIPWIAIDRDARRVAEQRAHGASVFFGDIRKLEVLAEVGAARARAVVVTIDSGSSRERIVPRLRQMFPEVRILVRARDRHQQKALEAAGAHAVVPETLEGSLQLAGMVLRTLGTPHDEVHDLLDGYRRNDYAQLEEVTGGK